MSRMILIPIVGTIAALIAILVFHPERDEEPVAPLRVPPAVRPDAPEPAPAPLPGPSAPATTEWSFNVEADGALTETGSGQRYGSPAEVLEQIAPEGGPSPRVVLGPAEGVTEVQLETAAAALRERCVVRIFRRG